MNCSARPPFSLAAQRSLDRLVGVRFFFIIVVLLEPMRVSRHPSPLSLFLPAVAGTPELFFCQAHYPMAWDLANMDIPGVDRTAYYQDVCSKC